MSIVNAEQVGRIRHLNDLLRCKGIGGQVMVTAGIDALGPAVVMNILKEVAAFTAFTKDNDPHGEHDGAVVMVEGQPIFFKIDYFDRNLINHSPDAADPAVTHRVMTVMLSYEY
ncbi:MAG: DUF3768 domain-containing protein [Rhodospirillaceae bacterium]|nr:MAG: DUF3768 domain-containing protein [Rhodospirillaceae bacterium]